jgi:hypothetical protein
MGKLTEKKSRLTAIHEHQLREPEVPCQPNFVRFLPAADFVKESGQMMNIAVGVRFRFARP